MLVGVDGVLVLVDLAGPLALVEKRLLGARAVRRGVMRLLEEIKGGLAVLEPRNPAPEPRPLAGLDRHRDVVLPLNHLAVMRVIRVLHDDLMEIVERALELVSPEMDHALLVMGLRRVDGAGEGLDDLVVEGQRGVPALRLLEPARLVHEVERGPALLSAEQADGVGGDAVLHLPALVGRPDEVGAGEQRREGGGGQGGDAKKTVHAEIVGEGSCHLMSVAPQVNPAPKATSRT